MEWVFFALLLLFAYTYLLFPAVMSVFILFEKEPRRGDEPTITILIPARNEARRILAKISNTLASDYPSDRLTVLVGSDGSADGTDDTVRAVNDPRVGVISWPSCEGKSATLNRLMAVAKAEIIAVSDADVLIEKDALKRLVRHLADSRVGAVCARRSDRVPAEGVQNWPQRLHNLYEGNIKRGEGVLGRVLGGDGSLYLIRKEYLQPIPTNVPDDFVAVLRVLLRGKCVAYENGAVAREELPVNAGGTFARRRRTVARGIRGLWAVKALLNPFHFPLTSLLLVSHKILRWFAGLIMLGLLGTNIALRGQPVFCAILMAQIAFYLGVVAVYFMKPTGWSKWLKAGSYFVISNIGAIGGFLDVVSRREWTRWDVQREDDGK